MGDTSGWTIPSVTTPAITMTMEMTEAKIGRLMKNSENILPVPGRWRRYWVALSDVLPLGVAVRLASWRATVKAEAVKSAMSASSGVTVAPSRTR